MKRISLVLLIALTLLVLSLLTFEVLASQELYHCTGQVYYGNSDSQNIGLVTKYKDVEVDMEKLERGEEQIIEEYIRGCYYCAGYISLALSNLENGLKHLTVSLKRGIKYGIQGGQVLSVYFQKGQNIIGSHGKVRGSSFLLHNGIHCTKIKKQDQGDSSP